MGRKRRRRGITLPWERRGILGRGLIGPPRWKLLVLIGILLVLAVGVQQMASHGARMRETHAAIAEMQRAIEAFRGDIGRCPRSTEELLDPPRPKRPYLREIPTDGWQRQLWVQCPSRNDPAGADVVSAGPSGDPFSDDNVM